MPRNSKKYLQKGYAIVEYEDGWKCHHNLDQDHHVSRFGDREWAWREAKSDAQAEGAAAQKARTKPSRKPAPSSMSVADTIDDNEPLFSSKGGDKAGSAVASGGAGGAAAPSGCETAASSTAAAEPGSGGAGGSAAASGGGVAESGQSPSHASGPSPAAASGGGAALAESGPSCWSLSFCEKYYSPDAGIRRSTAVFNAGTYDVTRATVPSAQQPNYVRFSVVAESGRMFYVAHLREVGPVLINVQKILPPRDGDWTQTLKCYLVFTARDASTRAESQNDKICDKAEIESLGGTSLRAQACKDESLCTQTYHCGDTLHWVDVRRVIGVVRWAPMKYRPADAHSLPDFSDFSDNYWSGCPEEADLIYVGQHFRQVK